MNRRKSRELAMKLLYQMSINKEEYEDVINNLKESIECDLKSEEDLDLKEIDMEYIKRIIMGVQENMDTIDSDIEKYLVKWKLSRLSKIDLTIMRICAYEIMFEIDIPNKVSINEGLELAKKYSEESSVAFINGVIDNIIKNK